jgi:ubiquinol-cytochrome c reductase cytochrome b subunit
MRREFIGIAVVLAIVPTAVVIGMAVELLTDRNVPVPVTTTMPPPGPGPRTPAERGAVTFRQACQGCHLPYNSPHAKAPRLDGYLSESWLFRLLQNPDDSAFFGHGRVKGGMDDYRELGEVKVATLAAFLTQLRDADVPASELPERLSKGRDLFTQAGCDHCHSLTPGEAGTAPNLSGYGSERWLRGLLADPGSPLYFGRRNEMPAFRERLNAEQIDDVVAYLQSQAKSH